MGLNWEYKGGIRLDNGAERVYIAVYKGVEISKHVWTPFHQYKGWGKGKAEYWIQSDLPSSDRKFDMLNQAMDCINKHKKTC